MYPLSTLIPSVVYLALSLSLRLSLMIRVRIKVTVTVTVKRGYPFCYDSGISYVPSAVL